jgi:Mannosyl-glycoprotein endo-beta-N-acetylglucosaminidase
MATPGQQTFVQTYWPLAQDIAGATGLDPSVVLGQAAQETGWGQHVSGNNIFGISPGGSPASYPDIPTAARAYVDLIKSRYAGATQAPDPAAQAQAIASAGYNHDPKYGGYVAQNAATVRGLTNSAPANDPFSAAFSPQPGSAAAPADIPTVTVTARRPTNDSSSGAPSGPTSGAPDAFSAAFAGPPPPPPPPSGPLPVVSEYGDLANQSWAQGTQPAAGPSPPAAAAERIGSAAAQGWTNTAPILTPQAQAAVDQSGAVGRWIINPLLRAAGAIPAASNAAAGGVAQAITEGAEGIGQPALGRDVNMLAQVLPFARVGTGLPLAPTGSPMRGVQEAPPSPRFVQEYYGEGTAANPLAAPRPVVTPNPLAATVNAPAFVPPGAPVPALPRIQALINADNAMAANRPGFVPPTTATDPSGRVTPISQPPNPLSSMTPRTVPSGAVPATATPQSVGSAATPANLTNMAPREAAASRATGEMQRLLQPQPLGVDATEYVPGVKPTAAEIAGDPETSIVQKRTRQSNDTPFSERDTANNEARTAHFDQLAGTPTIANRLIEARDEQGNADRAAVWANKQPVDTQPVVGTINGILSDPQLAERDVIQKVIAPLADRLYDADGNLKTDPQALYGVRQHIDDLLSKQGQAENPTTGLAKSQLLQVKGALDGAIQKTNPGWQTYLDNYSAASKPIDTMELLQSYQPNLTNGANRTMTFGKVDKMMRDIVLDRAAPGINAAKSINDDTMDALFNLHADLRRANNVLLGTQRGSSTPLMLEYGQKLGLTAAHGLAAHVAPVVGNAALHFGTDLLSRASLARRTNRLLNPNMPGQNNPLQNSGGAP